MADLVIRPSIKGVIFWYLLSALLLIGVVLFLQTRNFNPPELWALLVFPISIDIWASLKHVRLNARRLTLQSDALRLEDGLIGKKQRTIMLDKISDVRTEQSIGQRLVGVGTLSIEAQGDLSNITLENVDQPHKTAEQILTAMRENRNRR